MSTPSTPPASADERVRAAERVVAEEGISGALIIVEGHEREIAAIRVSVDDLDRLVGDAGVRLAERVRALGFRYVALDLLPLDG